MRRTIDPDGAGGASATDQFFAGYDGIHATLEFDGDEESDVSHRYLWGVGFDMLLADEQVSSVSSAGNVLWPLADHLGTIRDIADYDEGDPDFEITNHRVYDSFGRLESETNSAVDLAFGFTGKYTDEATGHTHHLNRWYDPATGRWLSEDPIGFAAGDTNLSRYVGNNPLHSTDPLGLFEAGSGYDGPQSNSPVVDGQDDEVGPRLPPDWPPGALSQDDKELIWRSTGIRPPDLQKYDSAQLKAILDWSREKDKERQDARKQLLEAIDHYGRQGVITSRPRDAHDEAYDRMPQSWKDAREKALREWDWRTKDRLDKDWERMASYVRWEQMSLGEKLFRPDSAFGFNDAIIVMGGLAGTPQIPPTGIQLPPSTGVAGGVRSPVIEIPRETWYLAAVRNGNVVGISHSGTSHREFVLRLFGGSVPPNAHIVTIGRTKDGTLHISNSNTYHGNMLLPPKHVEDALKEMFR